MQEKTLRADAAKRREALLVAAEIAIARHGITVPLETVCQLAGVGRATLYRNFADRTELMRALMLRNMEQLESQFAHPQAAELSVMDFLKAVLRKQVDVGSIINVSRQCPELNDELKHRFVAIIEKLLEKDLAKGVVSPDLEPAHILVLIEMIWGGLETESLEERQARETLLLGMLRATIHHYKTE